MRASLPYLAALQWVGGIVMGAVVLRHSRRYGARGAAPRLMCRAAMVVFLIAALSLVVGAPLVPLFARHPDVGKAAAAVAARIPVLLQVSQIAWILLIAAVAWNTALSVTTRRLAAAAELRRRAARVMAHRPAAADPPPQGGPPEVREPPAPPA